MTYGSRVRYRGEMYRVALVRPMEALAAYARQMGCPARTGSIKDWLLDRGIVFKWESGTSANEDVLFFVFESRGQAMMFTLEWL